MRLSGAIVLCYHRVLPLNSGGAIDPSGIVVPMKRFQRHMEILARRFSIVPLAELITQLIDGYVPPGQAAVTFDDGYADNYWYAFPILRRTGTSATIFLTTENVERGSPFWWDRLAALVSRAAGGVLAVPNAVGGGELDLRSPEAVNRARIALLRRLWVLAGTSRDHLLTQMGAPIAGPPADRPLSWAEIQEMQRHGIAFGGHSHSHPSLVGLPDSALRTEIETCRTLIEARTGIVPTVFAYPFGDGDDRVSDALQSAGFLGAFTTQKSLCTPAAQRYHVPRISVGNWNAHFFGRYLEILAQTGRVTGVTAGSVEWILKSLLPVPVLIHAQRVSASIRRRLMQTPGRRDELGPP